MIEREIKLPFRDPETARRALLTAGGRLVASRRLIEDRLFDTADSALRRRGHVLRVRRDAGRTWLTWKGPAPSALVKAREELETPVDRGDILEDILAGLGYRQALRCEKHREEFALPGGIIAAVDETPIGVFVELEGDEDAIVAAAAALGRDPAEFVLHSYPALYHAWCAARGVPPGDFVFSEER